MPDFDTPQPPPAPPPAPPAAPFRVPPRDPRLEDAHSKKILCGIMALFLGQFGIHKFILGYTTSGVIMILLTLSCIGTFPIRIISIIEGIMYLTKTDEEFYNLYILNKKEWF